MSTNDESLGSRAEDEFWTSLNFSASTCLNWALSRRMIRCMQKEAAVEGCSPCWRRTSNAVWRLLQLQYLHDSRSSRPLDTLRSEINSLQLHQHGSNLQRKHNHRAKAVVIKLLLHIGGLQWAVLLLHVAQRDV